MFVYELSHVQVFFLKLMNVLDILLPMSGPAFKCYDLTVQYLMERKPVDISEMSGNKKSPRKVLEMEK